VSMNLTTLVSAVVRSARVSESTNMLVVTICKSSINTIFNQNPMSSH
jgi:hypothetical protein